MVELNLGTQEIEGSADWEVTAGKGIITRAGHVQFFAQYIQAKVVVSQTLDTRNQPQINDLQLELGNIQVSRKAFCSTFLVLLVTSISNNFKLQFYLRSEVMVLEHLIMSLNL